VHFLEFFPELLGDSHFSCSLLEVNFFSSIKKILCITQRGISALTLLARNSLFLSLPTRILIAIDLIRKREQE